jgi:hypothetical protein
VKRATPRENEDGSIAGSIVIGLLLGGGIWYLSPAIAGDTEPFDRWGYYIPALCISGLFLGFVTGRASLHAAAAVAAGQILFVLFFLRPLGPLFMVGIVFIGACSALSVPTALAGVRLRARVAGRDDAGPV